MNQELEHLFIDITKGIFEYHWYCAKNVGENRKASK